MKHLRSLLLPLSLLLLTLGTSSCWSSRYVVGAGAQQGTAVHEDAWWLFWGFFQLDAPSTATMAQGATSYEIVHETSFWDLVLSLPTAFFLSRSTVTVER